MTFIKIPTRSDYDNFIEAIDLNGIPYNIEFNYNSRTEYWTINIQDENGTAIINGLPLLVNSELYDRFRNLNIPAGPMALLNLQSKNTEIVRTDLDSTAILIYGVA